jgi:hypothetical protein
MIGNWGKSPVSLAASVRAMSLGLFLTIANVGGVINSAAMISARGPLHSCVLTGRCDLPIEVISYTYVLFPLLLICLGIALIIFRRKFLGQLAILLTGINFALTAWSMTAGQHSLLFLLLSLAELIASIALYRFLLAPSFFSAIHMKLRYVALIITGTVVFIGGITHFGVQFYRQSEDQKSMQRLAEFKAKIDSDLAASTGGYNISATASRLGIDAVLVPSKYSYQVCAEFYSANSQGQTHKLDDLNYHGKGHQCYMLPLDLKTAAIYDPVPHRGYIIVAKYTDGLATVPVSNLSYSAVESVGYKKLDTGNADVASLSDVNIGNVVTYYAAKAKYYDSTFIYKLVLEKTGVDYRYCVLYRNNGAPDTLCR